MRKRAPSVKWTKRHLSVSKIIDVVSKFPLLHAYGVGLDYFRELPEQDRMKAIEYAKYILAYELDDEIDAAYNFLASTNPLKGQGKLNYKASYLLYMYEHWRHLSSISTKEMPKGALIVGALLLGRRVRIIPALLPDFVVTGGCTKIYHIERYLQGNTNFRAWSRKEKFWRPYSFDDREGDVGNEPQSADAIELMKGNSNDNECIWSEDDDSYWKD